VAESRAFVETLPSLKVENAIVGKRTTLTRSSGGLSHIDLESRPARNVLATSLSSERNFRKAQAARRNGVMVSGSQRGRITCDKQRFIAREADAFERNVAAVHDVLRGLPDYLRDSLFCMSGTDARHCVAALFPRLSCNARTQVVRSIHAEGQLRRRKLKGGGSFNAYGSEGPTDPGHGAASSWQAGYPAFAGAMPLELLTAPRRHRMTEGNNALQEHAPTCRYSVLPVQADGECFLRSMALQLRTQNLAGASIDIVEDYRVLSVLLLEALMAEKSFHEENDFASDQVHSTVHERMRAILRQCESDSSYVYALSSIGSFDAYCLDKLEGVMTDTEGLESRRWVDSFDLRALLRRLDSSVTMIVPGGGSRRQSYIMSGQEEPQFVAQVEDIGTDFLMVHWLEDTFEHFDPVYETSSLKQHTAPSTIVSRVEAAIMSSEMCQAYLNGNWSDLRTLALKGLKLPLHPSQKKTLSDSDLVWKFLKDSCSSQNFGRLSIGKDQSPQDGIAMPGLSLLNSWFNNWAMQ